MVSNADLIKNLREIQQCYEKAGVDGENGAATIKEAADALEAHEWRTDMENAPHGVSVQVAFGKVVRIAKLSKATGKWWSEYGHELEAPDAWKPLDSPPDTQNT